MPRPHSHEHRTIPLPKNAWNRSFLLFCHQTLLLPFSNLSNGLFLGPGVFCGRDHITTVVIAFSSPSSCTPCTRKGNFIAGAYFLLSPNLDLPLCTCLPPLHTCGNAGQIGRCSVVTHPSRLGGNLRDGPSPPSGTPNPVAVLLLANPWNGESGGLFL